MIINESNEQYKNYLIIHGEGYIYIKDSHGKFVGGQFLTPEDARKYIDDLLDTNKSNSDSTKISEPDKQSLPKSANTKKLKELGHTGKAYTILKGSQKVGTRFYFDKDYAKSQLKFGTGNPTLYEVEVHNGIVGNNYKKL